MNEVQDFLDFVRSKLRKIKRTYFLRAVICLRTFHALMDFVRRSKS
jgi:hypothetical protein